MHSQTLNFVHISLLSLIHRLLFSRMLVRKITHRVSVSSSVYSKYSTMPKKNKTGKSKPQLQETSPGPVKKVKDGEIAIAIHAKPGAKQNAITDVSSEAVGVAIAAPPTDGEANAELLRYLSKVLELRKSDISLDKGSKSREKMIKVTASVSPEDILERLRREVNR
ncbi:UPF0235 protein C15orf40 homolog [Triplophysa dalaica]|uniref:UPF0235 protein C15orf40 homolog n=1 Tax=Triplophysa dalaica TaxID=1582913 RepID=UPI0024DFA724|nr:UPF0235 protein C15orf40 homolog [Triplophysa dalaica]